MRLPTSIQKVGSVCLTLPALAYAAFTLQEVSSFGFPDGYVTAFQRAVTTPLTLLSWGIVFLSFLLLFSCFFRGKISTPVVPLLVLALVAALFTTLFAVPWFYGSYLGLDNGMGG